eukprot:UN01342
MLRSVGNDGSLFHLMLLDIPQKKYSMFWYSFKMQTDGQFLSFWSHNHGFKSVFAIGSHPDDIKMNKYKKATEHEVLVIDDIEQVKQDILGEATKKNKKICEGEVNFEKGPDGLDLINGYGNFYRETTRFGCMPWSFKKGEEITVISFMDRIIDPKDGVPPSPPIQHVIFRGMYVLEKEDDYDDVIFNYNMSICFEDPDECVLHHQSTALFIGSVLFNWGYLPKSSNQSRVIFGVYFMTIVILVLFLYITKILFSMLMDKYGYVCSQDIYVCRKDSVDFSPVESSEEEVQLKLY